MRKTRHARCSLCGATVPPEYMRSSTNGAACDQCYKDYGWDADDRETNAAERDECPQEEEEP